MSNILLPFGLIILIGIIFRRYKIGGLDADLLRRSINVTVLNIFLPALCIKIIYGSKIDRELILVPASAWFTIISSLLLATGVYRLLQQRLHIKPSEKGILIISAAFGNVSYLGLPVLTGLYGQEAARYALFYDLLASTPLLWLVGSTIASKYGENKSFEFRESLKTIASLPPIWAMLIGIILNFTGIPLPDFILKTLDLLANLVVPLMIFSIGLALTIPKVEHTCAIIPAVVIKLTIVPFISFFTAYMLGLRDIALAACFIEGAMPTMVLSLLIAARFRLDISISAFMIVVTTVLSFITLPFAIHITNLLIR
ncbi:MAG: AEC family transporter [Thermodesulfovibrionales bacterium]|nr:AEC family transporter [Thermodesulfovibrionales bacterium]